MYNVANTEANQTKDTFLKNGSNIIKNYSSSTTRRESDTLNPYVMESKIKDLEAKLSNLEQTNQMLIERLNNNERNFQIQLKQIQVSNLEEKENRYKAEKVISSISEQNNANSNDLNFLEKPVKDILSDKISPKYSSYSLNWNEKIIESILEKYKDADYSVPIYSFVGRLTQQKGVLLILDAVEEIVRRTNGKVNILVGGMGSPSDPYVGQCINKINYLRSKYSYAFWANPY